MVSVIIPTYNRVTLLKKAINSVIPQTYKDFELIIVDDGSTDNTKKLISNYKEIKYIYQGQKGPGSARNTGIKNAKHGLIAFLDSDDWWDKQKLSIQLYEMQKNPEYLISHTQETWYKNREILNQKKKHKKHHGYIFDKCLKLCAVSMSTVIIRRELFDKIGLFDETLPCCEDYDFWLRASINHEFLLIDKPLTLKQGGRPDQVSSIYATGMDKFRIESLLKLLKSGKLTISQQNFAIQELKHKCQIYSKGCIKHGRKKEGKHYAGIVNNLTQYK